MLRHHIEQQFAALIVSYIYKQSTPSLPALSMATPYLLLHLPLLAVTFLGAVVTATIVLTATSGRVITAIIVSRWPHQKGL